MRNMLALVGLVVVGFVGMGWYLDWYKIKTTPGPDGHRSIDIDLNSPKIAKDVNTGKEKVRDYLAKDKEPAKTTPAPGGATIPMPDGTTVPLPGGSPTSVPLPGGSAFTVNPDGSGTFVLPPLSPPQPPRDNNFPPLPPPQ